MMRVREASQLAKQPHPHIVLKDATKRHVPKLAQEVSGGRHLVLERKEAAEQHLGLNWMDSQDACSNTASWFAARFGQATSTSQW
jgi:hypothetical protein